MLIPLENNEYSERFRFGFYDELGKTASAVSKILMTPKQILGVGAGLGIGASVVGGRTVKDMKSGRRSRKMREAQQDMASLQQSGGY